MMYGYGGKILRINLSQGEIKKEDLSEDMVRDYIGSRGFAAKILYQEVPCKIAPFDEQNLLVVAAGPFSGVFVPGAGKTTFATKSPATGIYGDSNMGGHFAGELKYAGYDCVVLSGKAPYPTYIYIEDDKVELRDATAYWGKGALEVEKMLKEELGEDFQIATIGPAGENMVKFSCISHDFGRQAGRCGVGAIMGSKNLKAIAVKGTGAIPLYDVSRLVSLSKELFADCMRSPNMKEWQDYGTTSVVNWANDIGVFPTRNFQSGYFEKHRNLSGEVMREKMVVLDKSCFNCPMACGKYSHIKTHEGDVWVEGPEYETIALLGGNCALENIEDVAIANYLCDELGMDTISSGNIIAFAMECYQKGIITNKDTEGIELRFGDVEAVKALLNKMAKREGIGKILAEGVKFAAESFGQDSIKFAMQVKGLEWSGYESRAAPANLLGYMTADIGAHHNRAWAITHDIAVGREKVEGKAQKVIELQHKRPLFDMLGTCRLQWVELNVDIEKYSRIFQAITGIDYTLDDLLLASERVFNLNRMFAVREGKARDRSFDYPPLRISEEPVKSGSTAGSKISREIIDQLLDEYYRLRGWNSNGIPTVQKLKQLDLEWTLKDIPEEIMA